MMISKNHIYKKLPLFDKIEMFEIVVDNMGNAKGTDSYEKFIGTIKTMKSFIDEEINSELHEEGIRSEDTSIINNYVRILNENKELFEENKENVIDEKLSYWIHQFQKENPIENESLNILHEGEIGNKEFMNRISKIDEKYNDLVTKYNALLNTFKDYLSYTKF